MYRVNGWIVIECGGLGEIRIGRETKVHVGKPLQVYYLK
jgi:hypothetical protein